MTMKTIVTHKKKVCLARYHDGSAKPNWGGRATSLALAGLIDRSHDFQIESVINGRLITTDFKEMREFAPLSTFAMRVTKRLKRSLGSRTARNAEIEKIAVGFGDIEPVAKRLAAAPEPGPELESIRRSIAGSDEFWMNGEGDFILFPRRTLFRTLVYMQMAIELGKPVRLVNTILSLPPVGEADPRVIKGVGRILQQCASIAYRDPDSLRLHEELFPGIPATWTPDALFGWWQTGGQILGWQIGDAYFGPAAEGLPPEVQRLLREEKTFVVISGSSAVRSRNEDYRQGRGPLKALVQSLQGRGLEPVVVATCSGDDWMLDVAAEAGCPAVPARLPLMSGLLLLSRAACFASGRYHPSILASIVGAPVVLMTSNSHKNLSLQKVLGIDSPVELPFFTQSKDITPLVEAIAAAVTRSGECRSSLAGRMARINLAVQAMIPSGTTENAK